MQQRERGSLEKALYDQFRYQDWEVGIGTLPVRVSAEHAGTAIFRDVGMKFQRSPDTSNWKMYLMPKWSRGEHASEFCEGAAQSGGTLPAGATLSFSWSAPNRPDEAAAAIRQSAFLVMFSYFGYSFAYHPAYECLRDSIHDPEYANPPGVFPLDVEKSRGVLGAESAAVLFVREPGPGIVVILRFRTDGGTDRVFGVHLPSPDGTQLPCNLNGGQATVVPYLPERLATTPNLLSRVWREFTGKPKLK